MIGRRSSAWVVSVLVLAGLVLTGVAAGAPPTIERINIDETFADEFLTEECGVPVTTTARGHIIMRIFSGGTDAPGEYHQHRADRDRR